MSRSQVPQKLRTAIMRYHKCAKLEIRGEGDDATVWAWGNLYDRNDIEAEYWKNLGPLRIVKINVLRNYDPAYRPEEDI